MDDVSRQDSSASRARTAAGNTGAVIDVVETPTIRTDAATAARVDAWLLGAASTGRRAPAPARGSDGHRRRNQVVAAAAVVAVSGVVVALATRDTKARSAAGTARPVATNPIATTSIAGSTGGSSTGAGNAAIGGTGSTQAATTAAPTTAGTPGPTTEPAAATSTSTTATSPTTAAAPVTPLTEGELFQALVNGTYPSGVAWPQASLVDGNVVLSGAVPDDASAARVRRTMAFAPVAVIDKLVIDPSVPAPAAVLYTLDGDPVFQPGTTDLVLLPEGKQRTRLDLIIGLWAKRLGEKPDFKALVVVGRDAAGDTVTLDRADAIRLRFRVTDDALRQITIAISPTTGTQQVAFALAVVP